MAKGMAKTFSVLDEHHRAVAEYAGTMLDTLSGKLTHMPSNVLGCLQASAAMARRLVSPVMVSPVFFRALQRLAWPRRAQQSPPAAACWRISSS